MQQVLFLGQNVEISRCGVKVVLTTTVSTCFGAKRRHYITHIALPCSPLTAQRRRTVAPFDVDVGLAKMMRESNGDLRRCQHVRRTAANREYTMFADLLSVIERYIITDTTGSRS